MSYKLLAPLCSMMTWGVMRVAFLMCVMNALVIPKPSCCIVEIDGVGAAVYEYPKKGLVLVRFQFLSAAV